jgi:hypothetical protein
LLLIYKINGFIDVPHTFGFLLVISLVFFYTLLHQNSKAFISSLIVVYTSITDVLILYLCYKKDFSAFVYMEWFKTKESESQLKVFDPIRRRYVALTPEEKVRQQVLHLLVNNLHVPVGLIAVEYTIKVGKLTKRCDIVVFSENHKPMMIVECKAAHIEPGRATLEQAARYNHGLQVNYLMITNAKKYFLYRINPHSGSLIPCEKLHDFAQMNHENQNPQ